MATFICDQCGKIAERERGAINRSIKLGMRLYCGRICSGLGRRDPSPPSEEQRRVAKSEYDRRRREQRGDEIRAKKRDAYHAAVLADPITVREKEKAHRAKRMPKHVEYCRRPEYREWKKQYDRQYRAGKEFGDFGEASIILNDLIAEINSRASRTEIYRQNGTLNKWITRRRDYERQTDRR